jgi:hypothetical protein
VATWCRKNVINCTNVGDGTKKGRYLIAEKEVLYLKSLIDKFGVRKALMNYRKTWEENWDNAKEETAEPMIKSVVTNITVENAPLKKFNAENIATTISYIQDIKERLNDIEAEKNQLMAELEELRKEVMEYL